jgi:hypothetical protein
MDIIASIDNQIEQLKAMRAQVLVEREAKFDAAQIPLPIADEGWIEWRGGDRPVAGGARVDVRFSDGQECMGVYADNWCWEWVGLSKHCHIVAYRVAGGQT